MKKANRAYRAFDALLEANRAYRAFDALLESTVLPVWLNRQYTVTGALDDARRNLLNAVMEETVEPLEYRNGFIEAMTKEELVTRYTVNGINRGIPRPGLHDSSIQWT